MSLETGDYIADLNPSNPDGATDFKSQGDDHLRLVKKCVQQSFPNVSGAVTLTHTNLNDAALKSASSNTLTGFLEITDTGGDNLGALQLTRTTPMMGIHETDAAANEGKWRVGSIASQFVMQSFDDAESAPVNFLIVSRTGTTIDLLNLVATEVQIDVTTLDINGTADVSGSLTVGSNIVISNGVLSVARTLAQVFTLNSTAANGPYMTLADNGTSFADIGTGANMGGSFGANDLGIQARAGFGVGIGANGAGPHIAIATTGNVSIANRLIGAGSLAIQGAYSSGITGVHAWSDVDSATTARFGGATTGGSAAPLQLWGSQLNIEMNGGDVTIEDGLGWGGGSVIGSSDDVLAFSSGTFTGTLVGGTTSPTKTINYIKSGRTVTLWITTSFTFTSNAATFSMSGVPAALRPSAGYQTKACGYGIDNGVQGQDMGCTIGTGGSITFQLNTGSGYGSNWTSSGTKGLEQNWSVTYQVN